MQNTYPTPKYTHCFALSLVLFFCSTLAFAQNGNLKGRITTKDGEPAAYVSVMLKELDKATMTTEEGIFFFRNVPTGNYTVQVSSLGFNVEERQINVSSDRTVIQDIPLVRNSQRLGEVVVTGRQTLNETPLSVGKVPIKPLDLPQSVTVIGGEVLERQQVQALSEVLQNVNGVYVMSTTGGTQEEIGGRGFAFNSNNTFKNGSRYNNSVLPEMSSLERVEVMKGSNAILFGNVAAGGVLNLVTKKPKFESGGEVSMRVGSYDFYKPAVDVYGAINNSEKVAYRLNTTYLNAGSFRDGVSAERFYINPSLLVKAGNKTDILLEGDYLKDTRTPDFGIGAINYEIAQVPRSRFLGVAYAKNNVEQKSAMATITHKLNSNWEIRSTSSFQNYNAGQVSTSRPTGIKANGDWARNIQRSASEEDYYLTQLDLTGKFRTGFIEHTLLVGVDADKYDTETEAFKAEPYDVINIFDLQKYEPRQDVPTNTRTTTTYATTKRVGVYAQDLLSLSESWKVLAGLRYSYQDISSDVFTHASNTTATSNNYDYAFSPRAGLVYQPTRNTSLFVSYANSFAPNTGIDVNSQPLRPSIIDQYEVGIKNELFKGLLSANLTVYKIINDNQVQNVIIPAGNPDNIPANARELAGEVTSKGVELDLMSKSINGWSLIGGYSYNDTRYTKSNIYAENDRLRYNPAHTANGSVYYTFQNARLSGLNLGLSSFYAGKRLAGRNTRLTVNNDAYRLISLPDYFLFDAHVGYSIQRLSLRLKMTNLLNKLTYNAHDDNSVNPIAPRQFMATISYKL